MRISSGVYNALVNQALVMKSDSKESGEVIAKKVIEEYFRNDDLSSEDKERLISQLSSILTDS
jgi:hypothetical protein